MTYPSEDLRQWLANWPDGIIALSSQFEVQFASEKAQQLLGWPAKFPFNQHIHDIVCLPNVANAHNREQCPLCAPHSANNEPVTSDWLHASGEYLSVDYRLISFLDTTSVSNSPLDSIYRVISFTDNTKRKHNQEEMQKLAEYVDNNPAPLVELDRSGQMQFANPALQAAMIEWGFNEDGQANILPKNLAQICEHCIDNGYATTEQEVDLNSSVYSWHFHPISIFNQVSVIGYAFDITKQREAEQAIQNAQADARRDFYAKMMHELRTPLNAIIGFSDVLLWRSSDKLDEKDNTALKNIKVAGIQLNEMISDTLDISKIEAGKMTLEPETFVASLQLEEMKDQMQYLAEAKGLQYFCESDADIPFYSDRKKIRQILVNLISNAIKYTKKGEVWVSVTQEADILRPDNATITLSVKDTGIGIPEDQIGTLFKAYQRVRETKNIDIQGTGIGLALVWELVTLLNGKIHVTSTYGQGSHFTVTIPSLVKT